MTGFWLGCAIGGVVVGAVLMVVFAFVLLAQAPRF